jgi:hypothetical protein
MSTRFNRLPLWLPLFFLLHCIEELPTFISFGDRHGIILPPANGFQLVLAMLGFLAGIAWVSWRAVNAEGPGDRRMTVWLVLFAAVILHALLNVVGSLALREYAPGAFVAGLIYLPYGVVVFRRALREGWLSPARLAAVFAGGLVFYVGLAALLIVAGRALRGVS